MNGDRSSDSSTGHIIPSDIEDTFTLVGKLGEGVREEVKMTRPAARALINDLF